ncbi:MAG: hypothetical protein P1U63_10775 [Coxiellaceae bacterium]|nr:hypothetical protein [Coxiellaceae bacterium]
MIHLIKAFFTDYIHYAQYVDSTAFWFIIVLFSMLALGAVWIFCFYLQLRRGPNMQIVAIAQSNPGYVELHGKAKPIDGKLLLSPLTKTPCCWYRYKVWEYCPGKANFELIDYQGGVFQLLLIKDETDECVINVAGAAIRSGGNHLYYAETKDATREQMTQHYQQQAYCFEEEVVLPDSPLWVAGTFRHVSPDLEMGVNMNPDRAVDRIKDVTGEEWVDEMMEQRWLNEPLAAEKDLQQQWQAYCSALPDDRRPALMADTDLQLDQAYCMSTSQRLIPERRGWLFHLSGVVSVCMLVVIISMLWFRFY